MDFNKKKPHCTAILLAAGQGSRMGGEIPKHYIDLGGVPMMMHSLRVLTESEVISDIVLVVPSGDEEYCAHLCAKHNLSRKIRVFKEGGAARYDSVYNGLMAIKWHCDYVFIHDCARPFIKEQNLKDLFDEVCVHKACVAAVPAKDTVKISNADGFVDRTPVRSSVWIVQTPQVFECRLITEAYRRMKEDLQAHDGALTITDDAMVAERYSNCRVKLVMASYRNIKVTTPEDMITAEALLEIEGSPFAETEASSYVDPALLGKSGGVMFGNVENATFDTLGMYTRNIKDRKEAEKSANQKGIKGSKSGQADVSGAKVSRFEDSAGYSRISGKSIEEREEEAQEEKSLLHIDSDVLARIIARRINASNTTTERALAMGTSLNYNLD